MDISPLSLPIQSYDTHTSKRIDDSNQLHLRLSIVDKKIN